MIEILKEHKSFCQRLGLCAPMEIYNGTYVSVNRSDFEHQTQNTPTIKVFVDEFEAFEHLLIYVYSLEKYVFLTKKKQKKLWKRG